MKTLTQLKQQGFNGIRIVPDVHGMHKQFETLANQAINGKMYLVQLGDLIDRGTDSGKALQIALDLHDSGQGTWMIGNHEWKHIRNFKGNNVEMTSIHRTAEHQIIQQGIVDRFLDQANNNRFWGCIGNLFFAHASFDIAMHNNDNYQDKQLKRKAIYGTVDLKTINRAGFPTPLFNWVDDIPPHLNVFVGHHVFGPSLPIKAKGKQGGSVYMCDTGSGCGGVLTHIDIMLEDIEKAAVLDIAALEKDVGWFERAYL